MDNTNEKPPPKPPDAPSAAQKDNDTGTKVSVNPSDRPYYASQNQTSALEEYLYGNATYAKGATQKAWADSTKGRVAIQMVSRIFFGAAAFAWGNRVASKQMMDYTPETFNPKNAPALQWIAKGIDMTLGKGIKAAVSAIAPEGKKALWADEAVSFRHKGYFRNIPGNLAGRSLGAEMVGITFDFASMSTGSAVARNVIQSFDPALKKPWNDKDGNFSAEEWAKSIGRSSLRIFTKNQGEDWGAALPYVYQMKWQRQLLSKKFTGFKLTSDRGWNGGSMIVDKAGKVIGDYQLAGLLDLQFRFSGYNWYTLMYREAHDEIGKTWKKWQEDGFKIELPKIDNPINDIAGAVVHPFRYAAKSFVKSHLYMIPSVPFFWITRTPQTKWRAAPISFSEVWEHQNAYGSRVPLEHSESHPYVDIASKEERFASNTAVFANKLTEPGTALAQGGIHNNPGFDGKHVYFGTRQVPNAAGLGIGDAAFKWENQKTLTGKLLNPFGWLCYKVGSAGVRFMDSVDPTGQKFKGLFGKDLLQRELRFRTYTDAAFAYAPYFAAKTEFGLRVDDRGPGGTPGNMDKAIYGAIDNLAVLNIKGFQNSVGRITNLITHPSTDLKGREGNAPTDEAKVKKEAAKAAALAVTEQPSTKVSQLGLEARRSFSAAEKPEEKQGWAEDVQKKREQASFLYPPHTTLQ